MLYTTLIIKEINKLAQSKEVLQKQNFLVTAHSKRQFVVVSLYLIVQQRSLSSRYGLPSRLLDQEPQGSRLVQRPQLALVLRRPAVNKNTVALDEDLVDVCNKTTRIPESVPVFHPFRDSQSVLLVLRGRTQVARAEYVGFLLDGEVVVRDDPVIIHRSHLLHFVLAAVEVNGGGPRSEDADDCVHLLPQLRPHQVIRVGLPNGVYAANGKVGVHYGASVQRIIGDNVSLALATGLIVGFFLAGIAFDHRVAFEVFFDDFITLHVLMELFVAKEVGSLQLDDCRMPQEGRYLHAGVEDALHHSALHASDHSPLVDATGLGVLHN